MNEINGHRPRPPAELLEVFRELDRREAEIERKHERRMRDLRRNEWIGYVVWFICAGMILAAAVFNYLAGRKP